MKIITTILTFLLTTTKTFANPVACPVCAVVIVSGLSISRFFGVKDCVVGIWLGALLLAISSGLVLLLRKKNIKRLNEYHQKTGISFTRLVNSAIKEFFEI